MTTGDFDPIPSEYGGAGSYPRPVGGHEPASLGQRFLARLNDLALLSIVGFLLAVLLRVTDNILVTGLFAGLSTFIYFVAFESTLGWTLGKKLLGLRVLGPAGAPKPTLQQSAIRNSFALLSSIPFIGALVAIIAYIVIAVTINRSPTKQGKHDDLAGGTQVVKG